MEKCPDHDKCFDALNTKLEQLTAKLTEVLVRLEEGSGNFDLLDHRVSLLERIGFGMIALICTAVGGAIMAIVLYKKG